jgi:hypothetical protein
MTQFSIPTLISLLSQVNYQPRLSSALNTLINTRNQQEYNIALKEATEIAIGYEVKTAEELKNYGQNPNAAWGGVPLWQPVTLRATEAGENDLLLDSAVVSWNLPRNIVKTALQGRDGTVKEFIANGDYSIAISGLICSNKASYPLDRVIELDKFCKKNSSITIVHEVLNALGVFEIVIDSYDAPKSPYINCQQYSLMCSSDTPIELKVNDLPNQYVM